MSIENQTLAHFRHFSSLLTNEIRSTKDYVRKNNLFMQNKPNFRKVKLNVNKVLTRGYVQMDTWSIRKNKAKQSQYKANSKPIQTQNKAKQSQFQGQKMLLRMTINTRRKSLGYYTGQIEAPNAYDRAVVGCRLPGTGTRGGF
jgi:hypothetical protein